MTTVSMPEAQRNLPKLIESLTGAGAFLIEDHGKVVARVDPVVTAANRPSLRNLKPSSVGALLKPLDWTEQDLLGEMLGEKP